jgi:hypothetical protein
MQNIIQVTEVNGRTGYSLNHNHMTNLNAWGIVIAITGDRFYSWKSICCCDNVDNLGKYTKSKPATSPLPGVYNAAIYASSEVWTTNNGYYVDPPPGSSEVSPSKIMVRQGLIHSEIGPAIITDINKNSQNKLKTKVWVHDSIIGRDYNEGPAIKMSNKDYAYISAGKLHNPAGCAARYYIVNDLVEIWCVDGLLHRTDGPAHIKDGIQSYYQNGQRHRADGPAIIYSDGTVEYWLEGARVIAAMLDIYNKPASTNLVDTLSNATMRELPAIPLDAMPSPRILNEPEADMIRELMGLIISYMECPFGVGGSSNERDKSYLQLCLDKISALQHVKAGNTWLDVLCMLVTLKLRLLSFKSHVPICSSAIEYAVKNIGEFIQDIGRLY